MKKVLILSGPYQHGHRPRYSNVFSETIHDYEFTDIEFDNLIVEISSRNFSIIDSKSGMDIKNFDLVMVREYTGLYLDLAFVVSKYLQLNKVKYFNTIYLNYRPISKLAQAAIFYELGLPFPATTFSINHDILLQAVSDQGYPLIAKEAQASHGDNNFLVHSYEELRKVVESNNGMKLIIQEYLPNEHDYRVLVMNRKSQLQIQRRGLDDTHLNNTSKGGIALIVDNLPAEVLKQAEELVNYLDADLAGVDILQSDKDDKYYFLEINFQPQIISGALVDQKLDQLKIMFDSQLEGE